MTRLDWRWTLATASLGIALASPAAVAQVPADESLAAASSVRGLGYPGKAAHIAPTRKPISSWFTRRAQSYAGVINGLYDAVNLGDDDGNRLTLIMPSEGGAPRFIYLGSDRWSISRILGRRAGEHPSSRSENESNVLLCGFTHN